MKRNIVWSSALAGALTLVAMPALSQHRPHDRGRSGDRASAESRRDSSRDEARAEAPRAEAVPRADVQREASAPRIEERLEERRHERGAIGPRRGDPRRTMIVPRYERRSYVPRVVVPFYRPYTFRPRFHRGFGLYVGYPVPYVYPYPAYVYPYPAYPSYPAYGYPAVRPLASGPMTSGGISLELSPTDADVYVDGYHVGIVEDFDGTRQPLTLAAGRHRLEVRAPGYEPLVLDVDVVPGQVIPYRGDLRPY